MKNRKKIISAILASVIIVGTGSCGGGRGGNSGGRTADTTQPAETTADPNAAFDTTVDYAANAESAEIDTKNEAGAGKNYVSGQKAGTIKALCYYDFKNIAPENDILNLFAERFGGTVDMDFAGVTSVNYMEKLGTLVSSGDSPDIVRYEWPMAPGAFIQNKFTAMDDWLNKDDPVWGDMSSIIESFAYNGKHFYYPQQMQANYGVVYSTAMIEQMGEKDPMDLYFEGNWTWTEFERMLKNWMSVSPDNIGISKGESSALHLAATAGIAAIEFTGTDIVNNLKSPQVTKTMQFVENLAKEGYVWPDWRSPDEGFSDGKLLFYIMPIEWALSACQTDAFKNELEGEIRGVPLPRDPDNDKYNILGNTYGYLVPAGAKNLQGAAAWILAGRLYVTDPDVVKARRDLLMYDGPYYYPKCTKCKHPFESEYGEEGETCPECGEPRKPKFKVTYSERQMQVIDDMVDPTKFDFLFDSHRGFSTDLTTTIIKVFDDPMHGRDTYTHVLEENYNAIETTLEEFRNDIRKATGS